MRVLIICLVLSLAGCTSVMGTVEPKEFTSVNGETIVACEVKGWSISMGDGGLCRVDDTGFVSTQEGGRLSESFRDFGLGVLNTAGKIVSGLFGGIGGFFSGIGDSASPE